MSSERWQSLHFLLFVLSLVAAWEIVHRFGAWPNYLLPGPGAVADVLWSGLRSGEFLEAAVISLRRIAVGFGAALIVGLALGLVMAESPFLGTLFRPFFAGMQSLPSICWFPLALLWIGLNEGAVYAVTILGALFAIATAVSGGVGQIAPSLLNAASTMGAVGLDRYRMVLFPAILPSLVSGMRQGWAFAWRSLMAAELLFHNGGVGYLLTRARELNDVSQVISVILLILFVGGAVERLVFERMEVRLGRMWGLRV